MPDVLRLAKQDLLGMFKYGGPLVGVRYLAAIVRAAGVVVRERSLMPADRAMPKRTYAFHPIHSSPHVVTVNTNDSSGAGDIFSGAREQYVRRVYLSQPGLCLERDDTVLDLGANIGLFTVLAAVYAKRVVAVEAQSGFLPYIRDNLKRNGAESKAMIHFGIVGDAVGVLSAGPSAGSHWFVDPEPVSIESLIATYDLHHIDFLKVDIEGSEFELFGERSDEGYFWLSRVRKIAMEVHPPYGNPTVIRDRLTALGFHAWLTNNAGRRVENLAGEVTGFLFARRRDPYPLDLMNRNED